MYLPAVLPYPDFLKKIKPIIGSALRFLYIREPDCKKWKFESLYICLEDTREYYRVTNLKNCHKIFDSIKNG